MSTELIDPQTIRNVTVVGEPQDIARVVHHVGRAAAEHGAGPGSGTARHQIRLIELSSRTPIATLQRSIRMADGVLAVMNAATSTAPSLEAALRVADDHQVARMCLVTGLDDPGADFDRCVRTIGRTHGAVPLALHLPHGLGASFEGVVDLIAMWEMRSVAAAYYGEHWDLAERWHRRLRDAVMNPGAMPDGELDAPGTASETVHDRVRRLTHIGDAVPVLCDGIPLGRVAPLVDAIVRYLPSPMQVCQPEHVLDYY